MHFLKTGTELSSESWRSVSYKPRSDTSSHSLGSLQPSSQLTHPSGFFAWKHLKLIGTAVRLRRTDLPACEGSIRVDSAPAKSVLSMEEEN
ncbi:hypothetical protein ATANTOWER_012194 [Ataeniobius toweri]|uniref:Uncharacterized protein n=1 Tax=Ataeniobius toweri TaxID=208326 RepID=A0ABU7CGZ8_9TELE|nr:hypothetical protein [Ataeniobius toweri]